MHRRLCVYGDGGAAVCFSRALRSRTGRGTHTRHTSSLRDINWNCVRALDVRRDALVEYMRVVMFIRCGDRRMIVVCVQRRRPLDLQHIRKRRCGVRFRVAAIDVCLHAGDGPRL